jgi:hypothetical protein
MHWLSEEVVIRPAGPGRMEPGRRDRRRHEAPRGRGGAQDDGGPAGPDPEGADCLLWQAVVTGDPDSSSMADVHPSLGALRGSSGRSPIPGQNASGPVKWSRNGTMIQKASRRALRGRAARLRAGVPRRERGHDVLRPRARVDHDACGPGEWNLVGVIVDITARRDAELALAAEKERLAVTLGSMSEGVITIDARGGAVHEPGGGRHDRSGNAAEAVGRDVREVCPS